MRAEQFLYMNYLLPYVNGHAAKVFSYANISLKKYVHIPIVCPDIRANH